jgi:alpha-1,2-mannosyltransferase
MRSLLVILGAAGIYGWAQFLLSFHHITLFGPSHNAPGTDWMVYYGAINAFIGDHTAIVYDSFQFTDYLNATFAPWLSAPLPFHPWLYPPTFLLVLLPFACVPFGVSYAAFQIVTFAGLAGSLWRTTKKKIEQWTPIFSLLLCPAASINVFAGQNALMTGALLVGGCRLLERRPFLGGAVLGLLGFKPQFCLMVPVALVAARNWRGLLSAVATGAIAALLTLPIFGLTPWLEWARLLAAPSPEFYQNWLEWSRMYGLSVYTCTVLLGGTNGLANAAQLAAVLIAGIAVYWSFSRRFHQTLQITVLLSATVLAAPHLSPYDLVLVAVAVTLYVLRYRECGFLPGEIAIAACLWLIPLANPPRATPMGLLTPPSGRRSHCLRCASWNSGTLARLEPA